MADNTLVQSMLANLLNGDQDPAARAARLAKSQEAARRRAASRAAVSDANDIIARKTAGATDAVVAGSKAPMSDARVTPASFRLAINDLAAPGSRDAVIAAQLDLKRITRGTMGPFASKTVQKALDEGLRGYDGNGISTYSRTVDVYSIASVWAPVLESSDRVVRLIQSARTLSSAYAPLWAIGSTTATLLTVLRDVPIERREKLAVDMIAQVHNGRWWNITGGRTPETAQRRRRGEIAEAEAQAAEAGRVDVATLLENAKGDPFNAVLEALENNRLFWSPAAQSLVAGLNVEGRRARNLAHAFDPATSDPDIAVLLSANLGLAPETLPENPANRMLARLSYIMAHQEIDWSYLDEAETWEEIYPINLNKFPVPWYVWASNGTLPDGTHIEPIPNADALKANADYMGNCTFTYLSGCEDGTRTILRVTHEGEIYNIGLNRPSTDAHQWRVWEVNSRFNRGNVPDAVRGVGTHLIERWARLGAEGPQPHKAKA